MKRDQIYLICDGSCKGNQHASNVGGYGAVLVFNAHEKTLSGAKRNTSNNRMELTAMIEGLRAIKKTNLPVRVFTDSSYVANAFAEGWMDAWKRSGWKTKTKKEVKNQELWKELDGLVSSFGSIKIFRIKGHLAEDDPQVKHWYAKHAKQGDVTFEEYKKAIGYNHRADQLAVEAAEALYVQE